MLDINYIRENKEKVKKGVVAKNFDAKVVDEVLELDEKRRKLISEVERLRAKRNEIAKLGKASEEGRQVKEELQKKEPELKEIEDKFKVLLWQIPNLPSDDTPVGKDETENKVIKTWGKIRDFDFDVKDHVELGKDLNIIDIETAAKVSGARFNYLKGDAVLLQNALYQFALEILLSHKFVPIIPPLMVKADVMKKMARYDPVDERYYFEKDDMMFVGSAEHSLGPLHIDETLNEKDLPLRYFAYTPAFRREAGSYGKDTKGIIRQHQFDKVEMESFTTPLQGQKEQDLFVSIQEEILQKLELPYQKVAICTGDMGGPDFRQIDMETWIPSQGKYRETHTSDYMTDYQSRRLNTRVRTKDGTEFVHTNDATVLAMGRILVAILENYQNKDGSVNIPKVLQKWMGKQKITNRV